MKGVFVEPDGTGVDGKCCFRSIVCAEVGDADCDVLVSRAEKVLGV